MIGRQSWGKVAIGTRLTTNVPSEFLAAWSHFLMRGMRAGDSLLPFAIRNYHHRAANVLVRHFLRSDCDSLLFVDSDQIMAHDSLERLRDNRYGQEYDAVMALIAHRTEGRPIVMRELPRAALDVANDERAQIGEPPLAHPQFYTVWPAQDGEAGYTPGHVVPVDTVGLGFTLIRRAVFEAVGDPWFEFPSDRADTMGEDVWFSVKARAAGCRLAVDTSLEVPHLTSSALRVSDIIGSMEARGG